MQCSLLTYVPLTDVAREDLKTRMTEPSRYYHNLSHLELLWQRHLHLKEQVGIDQLQAGVLVAYAIAYHDAVFVSGASDNEHRSAELWLDVSTTATSLSVSDRLWIADTIRATADHIGARQSIDIAAEGGYARQWVLDLDLTPLGETPDVFDHNMDLLRAEAAYGMPQPDIIDLKPVLLHFASARPLYRCIPVASAFEEVAQQNFRRHLGVVVLRPCSASSTNA